MQAEIHKADDGSYELGGTFDGVFVPFLSRPATAIDAAIANGKTAAAQAPSQEPEPEPQL